MSTETIEVVCVDMTCFKVRADTLEPISCCYYEPAAWRDPQGRQQMSCGEWNSLRNAQRETDYRAVRSPQ